MSREVEVCKGIPSFVWFCFLTLGVIEKWPLQRCQKQTNPSLDLALLAQDLHQDLVLVHFRSLGPEVDLSLVQGSAGLGKGMWLCIRITIASVIVGLWRAFARLFLWVSVGVGWLKAEGWAVRYYRCLEMLRIQITFDCHAVCLIAFLLCQYVLFLIYFGWKSIFFLSELLASNLYTWLFFPGVFLEALDQSLYASSAKKG